MNQQTTKSVPDASQSAIPTDGNTQKDPRTWVTGGEPMTGAQRSYLNTLGQETGAEIPEQLTKAEASEKIEELKKVDPRLAGQA